MNFELGLTDPSFFSTIRSFGHTNFDKCYRIRWIHRTFRRRPQDDLGTSLPVDDDVGLFLHCLNKLLPSWSILFRVLTLIAHSLVRLFLGVLNPPPVVGVCFTCLRIG